jgi:hypothetical protein
MADATYYGSDSGEWRYTGRLHASPECTRLSGPTQRGNIIPLTGVELSQGDYPTAIVYGRSHKVCQTCAVAEGPQV